MNNIIIKLVSGFIFFGLALGLSLMLGNTLIDPIVADIPFDGYVKYTVVEVIAHRILQVVGIFIIWTVAYVINRVVVKDFT